MTDVLHEALLEATLAVLLGSTNVPLQTTDQMGNIVYSGTVSIPSAFGSRIQQRVYKGEFDKLIDQAMVQIHPEDLVPSLKEALVEQMLKGLEPTKDNGWNQAPTPGWLSKQTRDIAAEAATKALMEDKNFLEMLRQRVGMEVDRNRVGISVQLTDPEK